VSDSDKLTAFERFKNLARAIIRVPKKEVPLHQPIKRKTRAAPKQKLAR
jgi:hypothetical protein